MSRQGQICPLRSVWQLPQVLKVLNNLTSSTMTASSSGGIRQTGFKCWLNMCPRWHPGWKLVR